MRILAIVVTYYPDIYLLSDNINRFVDSVDSVLVWENTPTSCSYDYRLLEKNSKIEYVGVGENVGISKALNYAVDFCINNNYDLLLTMDQDTLFDDFPTHLNFVKKILDQPKIGCFTPNPNGRFPIQNTYIEYLDPITSGAIYKVDVFKKVGHFNEKYFIDGIDTEFCYRLFIAGLLTVCFSNSLLIQKFGDTAITKYNFVTFNYSSFRIYYIIRNHILLWRQYRNIMPLYKKKWFIYEMIIKWPVKILIAEKYKKKKIISFFKGCFHGLFTSI